MLLIKLIPTRIRLDEGTDINKKRALTYLETVEDILANPMFMRLEHCAQHGESSRRQHSINVSYYSYQVCKWLHLDARAAARAGLLHDLFFYRWQDKKLEDKNFKHVMQHPLDALENALLVCDLSDLEQDIITKHMFPFCYGLPRYRETLVVSFVDKFTAVVEVVQTISAMFNRGCRKFARYF